MSSVPPIYSMVSIRHDAQAPNLRGLGGGLFEVTGHAGDGRLELEGAPTGRAWLYRDAEAADVCLEFSPGVRQPLHVVSVSAIDQVVWAGDCIRPNYHRMKVYLIGIGWHATYFCPESTREEYNTYRARLAQFRCYIDGMARQAGDEITMYRHVYAENIGQVRRCYPESVEYLGRPVPHVGGGNA